MSVCVVSDLRGRGSVSEIEWESSYESDYPDRELYVGYAWTKTGEKGCWTAFIEVVRQHCEGFLVYPEFVYSITQQTLPPLKGYAGSHVTFPDPI